EELARTRDRPNGAAGRGGAGNQFPGGTGFRVGTFTKATGTAPVLQSIPHGLGEVPKALILWTESRPDETFSGAGGGITFHGASTGSAPTGSTTITLPVPAGTVANDVMLAAVGFRPNTAVLTPPAGLSLVRRGHKTRRPR